MSDGIPGWESRGFAVSADAGYEKKIDMPKLSPKELKQMMENAPGTFALLDVREKNELTEGRIPGSVNIPLSDFGDAANLDKTKKLIIYCASGARHYSAYRKLKKMSFSDISQITFREWKEAGMPIDN